jgi:hypothetical protein
MKMRTPHFVPLSMQAAEILRELRPLTGSGRYVFPGERSRDRPMSNDTVNAALRRLGSGKTTFAREYLPNDARVLNFVNADLIASGLSPLRPELAAVAAARLMLR